jgi:hypothetical protein
LQALAKGQKPELAGNEARGRSRLVSVTERPTKITFGELRAMGVRGVLVYCSDYKCAHSQAISAEQWADDVRLSDIEDRFVCKACGKRPDFSQVQKPVKSRE